MWNQDQESRPHDVDYHFLKKTRLRIDISKLLLAQLFVIMVTQKSQGKNIKICTNTILNEFFKAQIKSNLNQVGESHLEGGGGIKARS